MNQPQFDELQGYIRAEEHLRTAIDALRPPYTISPGLRNAVPYQDSGGQPTGLANVEVNYLLHPPQPDTEPADPVAQRMADNVAVFQKLEELWLDGGYDIVTRTVDQPHRVLRVQDPKDGFTIALKQGTQGNLWLTASSAPVTRTRIKPPRPSL
ncbi:hypothetical protein FB566_2124 [Stackebrandtia endophytica]|uniref:Uncharacterized protein n=1 Tax=Stackebrandtia endophytica TaxID=1496996 RepID=A0A543AVN2_9ACTN|nr:hypothetical protein [Stackebrandtia endophytica]TQL76592.1 hypothetical protein FB566_2124 [Stackebrandtia endophytica]